MKEKLVLREDGLVLAVLPPEEEDDETLRNAADEERRLHPGKAN